MKHRFILVTIIFSSLLGSITLSEASDGSIMQKEIKHVVVLMLENRSFDNVLAWLYSAENPPERYIPEGTERKYYGLSEDTLPLYTNTLTNSAGKVIFTCPPIKGIPSVANSKFINSPSHDPFEPFPHVTKQIYGFDGGDQPTMSGFLQDYASLWWEREWLEKKSDICAVMETYTDKDLPVLYALARHYAVSDMWFSSVPTQTNPNRAFLVSGTSEGQVVNGPLGRSIFNADTIWNRLAEAAPQTSWAIIWQGDLLPGIIPGPFTSHHNFLKLNQIPGIEGYFWKIDQFHELARKGELPNFTYIEPQWTIAINIDSKVKWGSQIAQIQAAVMGIQGNDMHPPGDVRTGENLLANIYTSLIANKESWDKTLFVILFDEHGGLFDHIPPPAALPPDDHSENGFKFDRYGVRVPAIFISPRIQKGTVIRSNTSVPFDHTSVISTVLSWSHLEKSLWNLGKRAALAPTFDDVVTLQVPRTDQLLGEGSNAAGQGTIVTMGTPFYLKNKNGEYLVHAKQLFKPYPQTGWKEERIPIQFQGGVGNITHGSFVILQALEPALGNCNLIEAVLDGFDCLYGENRHAIGQWWTIKSAEHANIGTPIRYGERVYIENHIYRDPFEYLPCRLAATEPIYDKFLTTKPITDHNAEEHYWIIEKAED